MTEKWRKAAIVIGGIIVVGLLLPSSPRVAREAIIDAPAATVFSLLNNYRQVNEWAPFSEDDPNARVDISGPPSGVGATATWSGRIIGQGRETITESVEFERIVSETFAGEDVMASSEIELEEVGGKTRITWRWQRHFGLNLAGRYFGVFLDGIRGPQLEKDLARLADMAERMPPADFSDLVIEHIFVETSDIAYVTTTSEPEAAAISEAMSDSFFDILDFIKRNSLTEAGAPISITRNFSGARLVFDAGIPIRGLTSATPRTENAVKLGTTYEGSVIRVQHVGAYGSLAGTHEKIAAYLAAKGIVRNGDAWESYVSDPNRTDESGLITYIYYPIRNSEI
ncbi:MAG: SRPBCC family protein [Woeseiaceae bacterium]